MFSRQKIAIGVIGLGFFLASNNCLIEPAIAEKILLTEIPEQKTTQFIKIEQPVALKLAVALGGLGAIGAELWWFMFSKKL